MTDTTRSSQVWTSADQDRLERCMAHVLAGLTAAMGARADRDDWIEFEREAVAVAANGWAAAQGIPGRVTVEDVERIEGRAVGHVDYASKLALYVTEFLLAPWATGRGV